MRFKLALALVAPLVLMAGCGGSKKAAPAYDGPVVPWTSSQPPELAERTPASTPCRAADLKVTSQVDFEAYGNGGGIAVIALQNKGKRACRLEGTARVRLVKSGGGRGGATPPPG